jgi:hypothetical protein
VKFGNDYIYEKEEICERFNEYFISSIEDIMFSLKNRFVHILYRIIGTSFKFNEMFASTSKQINY